ncbi:EI24 domain-containing protein [Actinoplanes sp. NPDC051494]|uniref:EI24 domain-containing protein n=1 Tax=Actinoplanes sp. NPDC051494 TaxID=3363907 RepID=UPI00379EE4F3
MSDSQLRTVAHQTGGAAKDFFTGAGLLGRGLGLVLRSPKLLGLGLLPALIAGLLYTVALFALVGFIGDLSSAVTWFADGWSTVWRDLIRVIAGAALIGMAGLLGVLTFTAVTLLVGDPFYEKISGLVEHRYGGVPGAVEVPLWQSLRRSLADSLRLIGLSVVVGVPLFVAGFIPLVGQTVVPVVGAAFGGWLLALELTGVPFERRGKRLKHRREALRPRRPLALGFGVAVFLCFLIPLGAILMMPAAVAGATLLSRKVFGLPISVETTRSL